MGISAHILQKAIDVYLHLAYPNGVLPHSALDRIGPIRALPPDVQVPMELLEKDPANTIPNYALRLGQPLYPYMKLALDPAPPPENGSFLLRVDAHDRHLHAPPGSPDADWLAAVRLSNKDLTERIEAAWARAGLPTFKEYLRRQLEARRANAPAEKA